MKKEKFFILDYEAMKNDQEADEEARIIEKDEQEVRAEAKEKGEKCYL